VTPVPTSCPQGERHSTTCCTDPTDIFLEPSVRSSRAYRETLLPVKCAWNHGLDEHVLLYSEMDEHRMETRKIEIYSDGRADTANASDSEGATRLSIEPLPSIEEINSDPQFDAMAISSEEFEIIWRRHERKGDGDHKSIRYGARGS
jgi:hypothetical protein